MPACAGMTICNEFVYSTVLMKKLAFFRHDVTMSYRRFFSWIGKAMPVCIVLCAAWVYISSPPMMTWMRNKIFDHYQTIEPRPYEPMPVTIIDI
ncbi:MAG: hypothetical protein EAZ74_06895, partial [Alphaproteobacteria bacterium]